MRRCHCQRPPGSLQRDATLAGDSRRDPQQAADGWAAEPRRVRGTTYGSVRRLLRRLDRPPPRHPAPPSAPGDRPATRRTFPRHRWKLLQRRPIPPRRRSPSRSRGLPSLHRRGEPPADPAPPTSRPGDASRNRTPVPPPPPEPPATPAATSTALGAPGPTWRKPTRPGTPPPPSWRRSRTRRRSERHRARFGLGAVACGSGCGRAR